MARPGAHGLGSGLGLKYDNCFTDRAYRHTFCGPALSDAVTATHDIEHPGDHSFVMRRVLRRKQPKQSKQKSRAGSAQLLRARAGPGPKIIFAGRAWA